MQQVTVGPKYQIVIPRKVRKEVKAIKPGAKVMIGKVNGDTITIKANPKNWLERTRGMMKDAWKGIDTTKYLDDLRNEWDQKA